ncbi:MAG: class I SAM-dependent methyltransferase [Planctomycetales bacterium]|nr:class I SAM-dependent methyltransferase [Planctomycetales bacterium]
MLPRTLEPEFMNDPAEAREYDQMEHAAVNAAFVEDLLASDMLARGPVDPLADDSVVLDVGTGTALIPIELCRRFRLCRVVAIDAASSMLEVAKLNIAINQCEHRIQLHHGDAKQLEFSDDLFDGVMSNSWLHHLPEPALGLAQMWRVCKPGGWLFCRDLLRPDDESEVERLVGTHAAHETPSNQQLFRQSLHAALTLDEVRQMARPLGILPAAVQVTSDRHWTLCTLTPPRHAAD